jgi:hypothetical protein
MQEGEAIRIIKLNVRINNIIIRDQFEWDINNPRNSPEVTSHSIIVCRISLRVCVPTSASAVSSCCQWHIRSGNRYSNIRG